MAQENNDFFRLAIANPDLTPEIFMEAGYNVTNLQLLDKDKYKQIDTVRDFYTDDQGNFKEDEFNQDYAQVYNLYVAMASYLNVQDFKKYTTYDEDNIFAPVEQKRSSTPVITRISNPKHLGNSQQIFGQVGDAVKSDDEIAQKSKVLMNPIEATNPDGTINQDIAVWDEAPDEGILSGQFWRNMAKTFVMALYEEDGEHINPITGVTEKHVKGLLKLNELGDPYYEYLDGRNIYGKRVLNKMNVLTPEDSWIQLYDFFDSDGVGPKSYTGTIFKNLALVGSMYLPGVGPYIAMLSMVSQVARLGAIGAKMLGQEGFLSNSIEGFVTSWDRQHLRSEYDAAHAWSFNNWFSGCADLAALIAEQRAIFTTIPALITGQKVATTKDQLTILDIFKKKAVARKQAEFSALKLKVIDKTTETEVLKARKALDAAVASGDLAAIKAAEKLVSEKTAAFNYARESMIFDPVQIGIREGLHEAEAFFETYNKWGEMLSKAYMAGLISSNLYNEARTAGIDENTASWLTIGRFAAEMGLLMTPIGNYFLPELHMNALEYKALANKSIQPLAEALAQGSKNATTGAAKLAWHRFIWDKAKTIPAQGAAILNRGKFSEQLLSAGTMGLEAGVVNDIEALFDDLAKAAYTVLSDNENEHFKAFENNFDRYGMGLVTGLIGGSISAGFSQYKALNANSQLTTELAIEKIAYMERNGKLNDFLDFVDKKSTHLASDHLTAFPYLTSDGTYSNIADPKAKDILHMSLNAYLKSAIHLIARDVKTILQTSGANISDGLFLTAQIAGDLRLQYFLSSGAANRYLLEFNSEVVDLIRKGLTVLPTTLATDGNRAKAERDAKAAENSEVPNVLADNITAYNELLKKVLDLMKGKKAVELARDSMFELTPMLYTLFNPELLTLETYILWKAGPNASEAEKTRYSKEFNDIILNKDRTHAMSLLFYDMFVKDMSDSLSKQAEEWKSKDAKTEDWYALLNFHKRYFSLLNNLKETKTSGQWLSYVQSANSLSWIVDPDSLLESKESAYSAPATRLLDALEQATDTVSRLPKLLSRAYLSAEDKVMLQEILEQIKLLANESLDYIDKIGQYIADPESENASELLPDFNKETDLKDDTYLGELIDRHTKFIEALQTYFNTETFDAANLNNLPDLLSEERTKILEKPNSNITNLLEKILLVQNDPNSSILQLFENLSLTYKDSLSAGKIGSFSNVDLIPKIQKALFYLRGIYGAVMTARTQDATLTDPYGGYNQILNTLANNYNKQSDINEKIEWSDLATMDAGYADLVSNDVLNIIDRLEHYLNVILLNSTQLLNLQHSLQLKYVKAYKEKAITFVDALVRDVSIASTKKIKDELQALLNNIQALDLTNLQEEDLELIYLRTLDLKLYIYNVGKALNILSASETNLSTLKGVFSYEMFGAGFMSPTASTLDHNTTAIDSRISLYEIASDMVSPAEWRYKQVFDAYREINKIRKDKPLAIIPALLDLAVLSYSQLLNKKFFTLVLTAFKENIKDAWKNALKNKDYDKLRAILQDTYPTINGNKLENSNIEKILVETPWEHCLLWLNVPEFDTMCTGIAGAGKSEAYLAVMNYLASKTLSQNGKQCRIAYISTSKEAAQKTKQKVTNSKDTDDADCFSHEEFINLISKDKQNFTTYKYNEESGVLETTAELKDTEELNNKYHYDLVLIDEVGFYNKARMQLLHKYGQGTQAHIYAVGDFEQTHARESYVWNDDSHISGLPLEIKDKLKDSNIEFQLTLQDANFILGWKLGIAMRPNNLLLANSVQALRLPSTKFEVHYVDTDDKSKPKNQQGLFGVMPFSVDYDAENNAFKYDEGTTDKILTSLTKLVATLNEGEKIGFIYSSENSTIYQALKLKGNLKDYFEFYQSDLTAVSNEKLAQGKEHRYCIAECPIYFKQDSEGKITKKIGSPQSARESLYTAASRSILGTILIVPLQSLSWLTIDAVQDTLPLYCSFDDLGIIRKNKEFNDVIDTLLKDVTETPKYVDPFNEKSFEPYQFIEGQDFTYSGTTFTITSVASDSIFYIEKGSKEGTEPTEMSLSQASELVNLGKIQVVNQPKEEFPAVMDVDSNFTEPDKLTPVGKVIHQELSLPTNDTLEKTALPMSDLSEGNLANEIRIYTFNTVNTRRGELEGADNIKDLKDRLDEGIRNGYRDGLYGIYYINKTLLNNITDVQKALDKLEQRFLDIRAKIISEPKKYSNWAIHTIPKGKYSRGSNWNEHPSNSSISHTASVITTKGTGIPRHLLVHIYERNGKRAIIPIGTFSSFVVVLNRLKSSQSTVIQSLLAALNTKYKDPGDYYIAMDTLFGQAGTKDKQINILRTLYNFSKGNTNSLIYINNPFINAECLGPQLGSNLGTLSGNADLVTQKESLQTESTSRVVKDGKAFYLTYDNEGLFNPTSLCAPPQVAIKEKQITLANGKEITIRTGHVFTIVPSKTVVEVGLPLNSDEILENSGLENGKLEDGYALVFLRSSSANVKTFIDNFALILQGKTHESIGGYLTSYHILKNAFNDDAFKAELASKGNIGRTVLSTLTNILNKLNTMQSSELLLNEMEQEYVLNTRPAKKLKLKTILSYYLTYILNALHIAVPDTKYLTDWLTYNVPISSKQVTKAYAPVDGNFFNPGKPSLFATVKVDSPVYLGPSIYLSLESYDPDQNQVPLNYLGILVESSNAVEQLISPSTENPNPSEQSVNEPIESPNSSEQPVLETVESLNRKYETATGPVYTPDGKTYMADGITIISVLKDMLDNYTYTDSQRRTWLLEKLNLNWIIRLQSSQTSETNPELLNFIYNIITNVDGLSFELEDLQSVLQFIEDLQAGDMDDTIITINNYLGIESRNPSEIALALYNALNNKDQNNNEQSETKLVAGCTPIILIQKV